MGGACQKKAGFAGVQCCNFSLCLSTHSSAQQQLPNEPPFEKQFCTGAASLGLLVLMNVRNGCSLSVSAVHATDIHQVLKYSPWFWQYLRYVCAFSWQGGGCVPPLCWVCHPSLRSLLIFSFNGYAKYYFLFLCAFPCVGLLPYSFIASWTHPCPARV